MASMCCTNSPNNFCYICGEFVVKKQQRNISDFVKKVYYAYFGIQLDNQDKSWAPHRVCSICVEELRLWSKGKKTAFRFGIPMIWREQQNHLDDCYFCYCDVRGFNLKNKKKIVYPNFPSAIRPVAHGPGIHIPLVPEKLEYVSRDCETVYSDDDEDYIFNSSEPQVFSHRKLNDKIGTNRDEYETSINYMDCVVKAEPLDIINVIDDDIQAIDSVAEDPLNVSPAEDVYNNQPSDNTIIPETCPVSPQDNLKDEIYNKNFIDEDKAFLLSLLPAIKELNGQQKMEFYMIILEQLKKFRYPDSIQTNVSNIRVLPVQNLQQLPGVGAYIVQQPPQLLQNNHQEQAITKTVRAPSSDLNVVKTVQQEIQPNRSKGKSKTALRTPVAKKQKTTRNLPKIAPLTQQLISQPMAMQLNGAPPLLSNTIMVDPPSTSSNSTNHVFANTTTTIPQSSDTNSQATTQLAKRTTHILKERLSCILQCSQTREENAVNSTIDNLKNENNTTDSLETDIDVEELKLECVKMEPLSSDEDEI